MEAATKKTITGALITLAVVAVTLVLWAVFTKSVEIDENGKKVAGGKRYATRFGLGKA
jgi:hypothetical protein